MVGQTLGKYRILGRIGRAARSRAVLDRAYKELEPVEGLGAGVKAFFSPKLGMFLSQPGKAHFVQILIAGPASAKTSAPFIAVAKKIVAKG